MREPMRPVAIIYRAEEDVVSLTAQANEELAAGMKHEAKSEEHFRAAGRLLLRIRKEREAEGHVHDWERWVKENIRATVRTVRRWMDAVRESEGSKSDTVSDFAPDESTNSVGAPGTDERHESDRMAPAASAS